MLLEHEAYTISHMIDSLKINDCHTQVFAAKLRGFEVNITIDTSMWVVTDKEYAAKWIFNRGMFHEQQMHKLEG